MQVPETCSVPEERSCNVPRPGKMARPEKHDFRPKISSGKPENNQNWYDSTTRSEGEHVPT